VGGATTFLAMSYIIFVQPGLLSKVGMDFRAVMYATCLSAAIATLLMGLLANYPVALAPGMGENFFFVYTLCGVAPLGFGLSWQQALAAVLLAGLFFVLLTLSGILTKLVDSIPASLKIGIAAGIGLFITFIGLEYGNLVVSNPASLVQLGDLRHPVTLVSLLGLLLMIVLLAYRVRGALLPASWRQLRSPRLSDWSGTKECFLPTSALDPRSGPWISAGFSERIPCEWPQRCLSCSIWDCSTP